MKLQSSSLSNNFGILPVCRGLKTGAPQTSLTHLCCTMCRGRPCDDQHEHWTKRRTRRRTPCAATRNASLVRQNHACGTASLRLARLYNKSGHTLSDAACQSSAPRRLAFAGELDAGEDRLTYSAASGRRSANLFLTKLPR